MVKNIFLLVFVMSFLILFTPKDAIPLVPKTETGLFKYEGDGRLLLKNLHLNELLDAQFRDPLGCPMSAALSEIDHILRDRLTQDQMQISRELLSLLDHIQDYFGGGEIDIISGYRSPELNSMLRAGGRGVASKSLHMLGMAIDFRMPGIPTREIKDYAVSLKAGGVGYYAGSDFVHIDVGRVRYW